MHMAEELVNTSHKQMKEEERRRIVAVEAFTLAEQSIKDLNTKLTEATKEKKSVKAALEGAKRQAESQRQQLCQTEDQLAVAKGQIRALMKKLEEAEEAADKAKQARYEVGVAETEEHLRGQVTKVCRGYCLQVWNESLNQAGVDAFSPLKRVENVFNPSALRIADPSSSQIEAIPKASESNQAASTDATPSSTVPLKEAEQADVAEKEKKPAKETALEPIKLLHTPKDSIKEKGASQSQELVLVTLPFTTKEDPKGKGTTQAVMPETTAKTVGKTNPLSKTKQNLSYNSWLQFLFLFLFFLMCICCLCL